MDIKIEWNELFDTYDVIVDGKKVAEMLNQDEVESITIKELVEWAQA